MYIVGIYMNCRCASTFYIAQQKAVGRLRKFVANLYKQTFRVSAR